MARAVFVVFVGCVGCAGSVAKEGVVVPVVGLLGFVPQAVKSRAAAMAQINSFLFIIIRCPLCERVENG